MRVPRIVTVIASLLGLVIAVGGVVALGYSVFKVPYEVEALDKRMTQQEKTSSELIQRLTSIEVGQKAATTGQETIQRTLLELTANFKSMADTSLQTWRTGMETSEKMKNYQVYVDGRMSDLTADIATLRTQLQQQARRVNGGNSTNGKTQP